MTSPSNLSLLLSPMVREDRVLFANLSQALSREFFLPSSGDSGTSTTTSTASTTTTEKKRERIGSLPFITHLSKWNEAYLEELDGFTRKVKRKKETTSHAIDHPETSSITPPPPRQTTPTLNLNVDALRNSRMRSDLSLPSGGNHYNYSDDDEEVSREATSRYSRSTSTNAYKSTGISSTAPSNGFMTAKTRMLIDNNNNNPRKGNPTTTNVTTRSARGPGNNTPPDYSYSNTGGEAGGGGARPFKPPTRISNGGNPTNGGGGKPPASSSSARSSFNPAKSISDVVNNNNNKNSTKNTTTNSSANDGDQEEVHPLLKNIPPDLVERIENEILDVKNPVKFEDIAGLSFAKQCIEEMVVWPIRNPEFYTGLRKLPKGLLLFGPPGTGKTLIGKAIAHECNATFFSVSASSLTSKWIGEGEKMVRALFAVATLKQPSVVFIDEIDSLLTQRSSEENEASRRMKTEFLVQLDGAATGADDLVLVIGATNRPQELDEAARRRFIRRLYIPLPDEQTRISLLRDLLKKNENEITEMELEELGRLTEGYSGADVTNLAREASMGPLRDAMRRGNEKPGETLGKPSSLRKISRKDFDVALKSVKASVSQTDLHQYVVWNETFGTQQFVA